MLDRELRQLDARRTHLLTRRAWLLAALRPPAAAPPVAPPVGPGQPWPAPAAAETSSPGVQNLLLTLGGILLAIAAIAFTLVSWGEMGIAGRSAVLGTVTVAALGTPVLLLRRGLAATAESVAVPALVLTVLDAYALHRAVLPGTDGLGYAAAAAAVLAALWTAYGLALPRLRTPLPAAVVAAQLPLPFWALISGPASPPMEWALLLTAALDVAVLVWAGPLRVRTAVAAAAATTGGAALLTGGLRSLAAGTPADAAGPAALLAAAAALALFTAWRVTAAAWVSAVAGLAAVAAAGAVIRTVAPDGWAVIGHLLCGVALLGAVGTRTPRRLLPGLVAASGAVHAAAALTALPLTVLALAAPVRTLTGIWSGVSPLPDPDASAAMLLPAPMALLITASVLVVAARHEPGPTAQGTDGAPAGPQAPHPVAAVPPAAAYGSGHPDGRTPARRTALCGAVALVWAASAAAPLVFGFAHAAAVAWQLMCALALTAFAVRRPGAPAATAAVCAALGSFSVVLLSLATRPATFTVLGGLVVAAALAALRAVGPARPLYACASTVCTTALAGACAGALELSPHRAAPVVLAVPALTALLGAVLRRHPVALPVEITGAGAGVLAVALAAGHAATLALVLTLCGVVAAATAVRAERRPVAAHLAAGLFLLASWVRLVASGVGSPEAYTLPVTALALAVGVLRRRRDPEASSWTAYGPGLAVTLVPSLVAAWGDEHWLRPLLLGLSALAVILTGARLRLQAPLVLGGATLALVALHELAPYVVQVVGALPRWLPPALAGLLLLAVGATYEQRLRDARRLREGLGRMR